MKTSNFLTDANAFVRSLIVGRKGVAGRAVPFFFSLLIGLALSFVVLVKSAEAAAALTVVSLTFDDGLTQSPVRDILRKYGMKGTFYVNANLIGTGGDYLTKAELDALQADGNEIGGHTTNHVDLATLSSAEQRTAICGDLQTLNTWYPGQIHSFAYPFASTGPDTQTIVSEGCVGVGQYSARTVGGLVSGAQCTGCATAEAMPPGNPYYIKTPESILSTTTLAQLQTLVTQAENGGGGWVPLVFHRVCTGCSTYAVTAATLDAFLSWLQARQSANTYVKTVYQVMSGDTPPPPPPPALGPNLLLNSSLELDQDGNAEADCWQRNGYGTNTAAWARTTDAQSGSFAERLQITAYSSGDRKLLAALDAGQASGGCSPVLEAGAVTYRFGAWYKSTTIVTPVLFYRDSAGVWQYWRDGPQLPASSTWSQTTFYPGTPPAGARVVSFGIALDNTGTLTTDNYSVQKVLDGSSDATPPSVSISAPSAGAVSGTITVLANAADNVGVAGVQFKLDGANLGAEDTVAPHAIAWNTATAGNGTHTLTAVARDAAGNTTTSSAVIVTVSNADTTAPTVSISAPAGATTVSGTVTVAANAADNTGVAGVQFKLDGVNLGAEDTTAPYSITWNTAAVSNGAHTLTAVARDLAGILATSNAVSVTVGNGPVNASPVANADLFLYRANVNRVVSAPGVLGNDTDPEGNPLTVQFVATSLLDGGTLTCPPSTSSGLCSNGSFAYFRSTGSDIASFRYLAFDGSSLSAPAAGATVALRVDAPPITAADDCSYARGMNTVSQPARCVILGVRMVRMNVVANDYDPNHSASPSTVNNPTDGVGRTVIAGSMLISSVGTGVNVQANAACGQVARGSSPGTRATITNNCDGTVTVLMTLANTRNVVYSYTVDDDLGARSSARQVTLSSLR